MNLVFYAKASLYCGSSTYGLRERKHFSAENESLLASLCSVFLVWLVGALQKVNSITILYQGQVNLFRNAAIHQDPPPPTFDSQPSFTVLHAAGHMRCFCHKRCASLIGALFYLCRSLFTENTSAFGMGKCSWYRLNASPMWYS